MGFSIGKIFRSVTKPIKKVLKSDIGKIGLGLAAYKWGPGFLSGKGFGMGDASKWGNLKWLGEGANVNPMRLAALTGIGSLAGNPHLEEEDDETMDIDTGEGQKYYLRARQMFPEFRDDTPLFGASEGGRVKANRGMYTGDMAGRALGQGLGSMNPMVSPQGMQSPHGMAMNRRMDPRMVNQQQAMMQPTGPKLPKESEDNELIQLIKMLSSMGVPMEQLRGRTKDELVEMAIQISGKGKETMEATEEVVQANTGGLMRSRYANGADVEGTAASEDAPFHQQRVLQEDLDQSGGVNSIFGGPSELEEAEYKSGLLDDKYKRSEIRLSLAKQIRKENPDWSTGEVWDEIRRITKKEHPTLFRNYAQGGLTRTGYALGSSQFGMGTEHPIIPDKDGPQLDMRDSGGYQPHGKKEKHDDVRALLAQGEFVMTSDAVKGMGGGDREKGAQKMYELMHTMEAMA